MSKTNLLPPEALAEQRIYADRVKAILDEYKKNNGQCKKAFVLTFGCQQNEADSEKIAGMAESMGYEIVHTPEEADLIMVNTCAIREHAELKALSIVGQYKHLKAKKPDMLIGICGCMVTQEHRRDDIKFRYPYVDFVLGTSSLHRLPQMIFDKMDKGKRLYCPEEKEYLVVEGLPIHRESRYRAWVSIMYGCNNFCSYCIVPYVRGRERSRRKEDIYEEVRGLVADGYRDITLLGQNVNSYGKDNDDGCDFADLLTLLDSIEGDYTLHFMTSHPKDATKKLVDVMASGRHIAKHFHLPMQSGSDRILKLMNRHYDTARYLEILDYMRERIPELAVTSDIIVGFPGETEEDFKETLKMLERVKFDMIYSFIYSPRKGTPAAEMEEQISDKVKSERFERLLAAQNAISLASNKPYEDRVVRVLCDGVSKTNDKVYSGRTEQSKIVFFDGCEEDTGKFLNVHITRVEAFALYGEKNN